MRQGMGYEGEAVVEEEAGAEESAAMAIIAVTAAKAGPLKFS